MNSTILTLASRGRAGGFCVVGPAPTPGNFVTIVTRLGIRVAIATAFQVRDRELDLAPRSVGWRVKPRPPQMCRCSHRASAASWHSCWIGHSGQSRIARCLSADMLEVQRSRPRMTH